METDAGVGAYVDIAADIHCEHYGTHGQAAVADASLRISGQGRVHTMPTPAAIIDGATQQERETEEAIFQEEGRLIEVMAENAAYR